jgi:hypothetical protein
MPRNLAASIENNFVKGLITEATGLNFPENACTSTFNCRFSQVGEVRRRLGLDYEVGFSSTTQERKSAVISEYVWGAVAGTGNVNFAVVQIGKDIHFYQISSLGALSAGKKSFTIDLEDYQVVGSPKVKRAPASFTSGKGFLFIAHPYCNTLYVEYSAEDDDITVNEYRVEIRDFEGVEDGLRLEERPTTLSNEHKYNLYNQGWYKFVHTANEGAGEDDPIARFFEYKGEYPNNCDIWWLYKNEFEAFKPNETFGKVHVGNTPAPKGHFILKAFREDRSEATEVDCTDIIPDLDIVSSGYFRPTCVAFYAGRVWHAGVTAQGFSSKLWFSQILDDISKVNHCYQQQDPTSEDNSELLDSDGGVIEIQEIGSIIKLFTAKSALIVFASNGVWAISGTQDSGFSATDFQVEKISSVPTLSAISFVDVFGTPIWWNHDGIYTLTRNQVGQPEVKSLTDETIKTFFDSIPANSKKYAKGAFNPLSKEVQWVYSSTNPIGDGLNASTTDLDPAYTYNSILCLNTLTGAFYPWTIDTTAGVQINGILSVEGIGSTFAEEDVFDENDATVTTSLGATVTVEVATLQEFSATIKYLVSKQVSGDNYTVTFGQEIDTTYKDWETPAVGVSFSSTFVTGYKVRGNAISYSQIPYIVVYTREQSNSSLLMKVIWDYVTDASTKLIGRENQMYGTDTNRAVRQRRVILRGTGRAVQLSFYSEAGKPFNAIGWGAFEAINAQP